MESLRRFRPRVWKWITQLFSTQSLDFLIPATRDRSMLISALLGAILLCLWIAFAGSRKAPADRKVSTVAVSRTGRWLAAGTAKGRITVWDQARREGFQEIDFPHGALNDLQFSPDEHTLAIAAGDLALYTLGGPAPPRLVRSDRRNYGSVRFSRDGQTLLVITGPGNIETIDAKSGTVLLQLCCSTIYGEVTFTPDEAAIVNAGHWPSLWDARSGQLVGRLTTERQFSTFRPIAFDARRGTVVMGSQDGRVYAWNLEKRELIGVSPAQSAYVDTLAAFPSGWVAFAAFGKVLGLWNPQTGRRRLLQGALPTSNIVAWQDGRTIVFGTAGGEVEFWDLFSGRRLRNSPYVSARARQPDREIAQVRQ